MLGSILGDIIGSRFERDGLKNYHFDLYDKFCSFTDDTVLTLATSKTLLGQGSYENNYRIFANRYPYAGFGGTFHKWMADTGIGPYNSWGNGSAMRVSPVAYVYNDLEDVLKEAKASAEVTHNHPEGIKGAQAIAGAIFLARKGYPKGEIKKFIEKHFDYSLNETVDTLRPYYRFDVSCQGSVPESIICFLESTDYESAVRNAISLGGDTDTMACMAGGIAEAFYGEIPEEIMEKGLKFLNKHLLDELKSFCQKYVTPSNEFILKYGGH